MTQALSYVGGGHVSPVVSLAKGVWIQPSFDPDVDETDLALPGDALVVHEFLVEVCLVADDGTPLMRRRRRHKN